MLLSYAAINYLAIASTSSDVLYYPRYALPIIVVLAIIAGRTLADLSVLIARRRIAWYLPRWLQSWLRGQ